MHALRRSDRHEQRINGRQAEKIAVLFVDIDGFKPVNDALGHSAGDQVLKETAMRLRASAATNSCC